MGQFYLSVRSKAEGNPCVILLLLLLLLQLSAVLALVPQPIVFANTGASAVTAFGAPASVFTNTGATAIFAATAATAVFAYARAAAIHAITAHPLVLAYARTTAILAPILAAAVWALCFLGCGKVVTLDFALFRKRCGWQSDEGGQGGREPQPLERQTR